MSHPQSGRTPLLALVAILLLVAAMVFFLTGENEPSGDGGGVDVDVSQPATTTNRSAAPEVSGADRRSVAPVRETASSPIVLASTVSGLVINREGDPVADVKILLSVKDDANMLVGEGTGRGRRDLTMIGRTDKEGRYEFTTLPLGHDFDMWLYHPDYAPTIGPPLTTIAGEDQEMMVLVMFQGWNVTGHVTDTAGNPLQATVEARMQAGGMRLKSQEELRKEDLEFGRRMVFETAPDGSFEFRNMAEGIWEIEAFAEGYAAGLVRPIAHHSEPDDKTYEIALDTEYVLGGQIVDSEGNPVPHALVYAGRVTPRPLRHAQADADENGQFLVRGLEPGIYGMYVSHPGFSPGRLTRVSPDKVDIEIVMQRQGGVSGVVTDPMGAPVENYELTLYRIHRRSATYGSTGTVRRIENADGFYELREMEPATYVLLVRAEGYAPTYSPGFRADREVVQGVDIQLRRGSTITGYVTSAVSGAPLPGAEVVLRGKSYKDIQRVVAGISPVDTDNVPVMIARCGPDGSFKLENAYPGEAQIELRHPTHLKKLMPVVVEEGVDMDLGSVQLPAGGTIMGRALDAHANPLSGGMVYVTRKPESGSYFADAKTVDARGRYRFDALPGGVYEVSASSYDSEAFTVLVDMEDSAKEVIVREGETYKLDLFVGE